jgi:hypothetical protein
MRFLLPILFLSCAAFAQKKNQIDSLKIRIIQAEYAKDTALMRIELNTTYKLITLVNGWYCVTPSSRNLELIEEQITQESNVLFQNLNSFYDFSGKDCQIDADSFKFCLISCWDYFQQDPNDKILMDVPTKFANDYAAIMAHIKNCKSH